MPERTPVPTCDDPSEVWRRVPLPNFDRYEVSSHGRVRRGRRILRTPLSHGYPSLRLSHEGSSQTFKAHALVALAFIGPRPPRHDICHNNGDKTDNRAENLRYDTHRGNLLQMAEHGTLQTKLSSSDVAGCRTAWAKGGVSLAALGRTYGVRAQTVRHAITGATFAWLLDPAPIHIPT